MEKERSVKDGMEGLGGRCSLILSPILLARTHLCGTCRKDANQSSTLGNFFSQQKLPRSLMAVSAILD